MCIIYYNERGAEYDLDEIHNGWNNNPDGVGLMWVEDGEVKVIRDLIDRETTVELARSFEGVPHVLHLRWATHGSVCVDLCHPFRVTPDGASKHAWMMHNGVIRNSALGETPDKRESDSLVYARQLQAKVTEFGEDILFQEIFIREQEKRIGSYNKVIILRDDGQVALLNPDSWYPDFETGIWYSNQYSLLPTDEADEAEEEELEINGWHGDAISWSELFNSEEFVEYQKTHGIYLEEEE